MIDSTDSRNCAFYRELCLLRLLHRMGYLDEAALNGIAKIAAEEFQSTLIVDRSTMCLNS